MSTRELGVDVALEVGAELGEGPVWDASSSSLVFVDIEGGRVHRYWPSSGAHTSFATGEPVGAAVLAAGGGLVLALVDRFASCGADGEGIETIGTFSTDRTMVRFNDGEVDPWGRFVAGTMDLGHALPVGALYQLDPSGAVSTLVEGVTISNGLAWTADRRALYYVDTPSLGVDVFEVDAHDGSIGRRQRWRAIDPGEHGQPDGIALDAEGCLWVACYGGGRVVRFAPDGHLDTIVRLPVSYVTSVAFGGSHLDELYITSATTDLDSEQREAQPHAGDVFVVAAGVSGAPPSRFG